MRLHRRSLIALALLRPVAALATPATATSQHDLATVDLVRLGWADVGAPTPFRVSTAGPGGAVLLTLIYDTLTWKDERGIIPWLATEWTTSRDGQTYTFAMTSNARWHDGQLLTAADVAFSFTYYAKHPYRWTSTAVVERATVSGPNQVQIQLTRPYAPFLEEIAGSVPIIPQHVWSKIADPETYQGAGASIGSGPFQLAAYRSADGSYQLHANSNYFRGTVRVKEFQQLNTPSQTQIQAIQQDDLDLALSTDPSVQSVFATDSHIKVFATAPQSIVRLAVNTERTPLDRKEVRQAIAYALDRPQIARVITKDTPVISDGVIPPGSPWFDPNVATYEFNPGKSRQLLAGKTYTIELLAGPNNREPELMGPMLKAVGINLTVKRVDGKTRTQLLREGNFQLGLIQHIGIGGDPDFLRRWYSGEESNDYAQGSIFHDPAFDRLATQQAATLDPAARKALVFQMQSILADELPTIVLYDRRFYWVYDSAKLTPMNTWGGVMNGIPFVDNKLIFLSR